MVRLNKIYTRKGDKGRTSLAGGVEISKNSLRIFAIGDVDETNALIGIVQQYLEPESTSAITLRRIQDDLFDLGADLATPGDNFTDISALRITQKQVSRLEKEIDKINKDLTPLNSFILPGGNEAASLLHLLRTVCRRAERKITGLAENEPVNPAVLSYINRLSDLFFVLSRFLNHGDEILWRPGANRST